MGTVSKTLNIVANTTYNLAIDLWSWSIWATEAGITTTYSSLANLLADEKAVRQLMLVHKSVDYLANYPSGADRETLTTIINNDICAKWINISDYAYDTLSANSDIKSVMDTADKYGYGEWGKIDSTTWGALGCVPIMTSNNAPYGVASAYQVFDGNASTTASSTDFSYKSVNPICVRKFECSVSGGTLQGSNDGSNWTDISTPSENTAYYMYHRVHFASSQTVHTLQFYGREGKKNNNATYIYGYATNKYRVSDGYLFPDTKVFIEDASTVKTGSVSNTNIYGEFGYFSPYYVSSNGRWRCTGVPINRIDEEHRGMVNKQYSHATNNSYSVFDINEAGTNYNASYFMDYLDKSGYNIQGYYYNDTIDICTPRQDYSEKEFASNSNRLTIYDHGVELESITGGTKNPDCLTLSAVGTATATVDKGSRTYMGGKAGLHASGTNRLKCGSGYSAFTASNMPDSNGFDISSISGSVAVGIEQTASGTFDCTEIWIE